MKINPDKNATGDDTQNNTARASANEPTQKDHSQGINGANGEGANEVEQARPPAPQQVLMRLLNEEIVELWHDENGEPYATIRQEGHLENHPIHGDFFETYLPGRYFQYRRAPLPKSDHEAVKGLLVAFAVHEGERHEISIRVAHHDGAVYVDLGSRTWEAVEIDVRGYRVVSEVPVKFIRKPGMAELPHPAPGADGNALTALRHMLNVPSDEHLALLCGYLLGCLNPVRIYPVLVLSGGQGTGKTTLAEAVGRLIDPSTVPTRSAPRKEDDLLVSSANSFLLSFDNVSGIRADLSDSLCRLSTRGGFRKRKLYTDLDEAMVYVSRPVVINGIDDLALRNDLADRAIVLHLPPIPDDERKTTSAIEGAFEEHYPDLLGALYACASTALRNRGRVELEARPRMADLAEWVAASEEALPFRSGLFMKAYEANQKLSAEQSVEDDLVASAVLQFMEDRSEWEGSTTELIKEVSGGLTLDVSPKVPKDPKAFSSQLRRAAPALERVGVRVSYDPNRKDPKTRRTLYTLQRI